MKAVTTALAILSLSCVALAKDPPAYQKGVLLQMESVSCGYAEKGGKSVTGEILGTEGEQKKTKEMLCQEYILQTNRVIYRIRPKDDKHPVLLPLGETAEFRIDKDKMKLRVLELDDKERDYTVVSMTMRSDIADNKSSKDTRP